MSERESRFVLCVEDNSAQRDMLTVFLRSIIGLPEDRFYIAPDLEHAYRSLETLQERGITDPLVLLDLDLGRQTGFAFLQDLKGRKSVFRAGSTVLVLSVLTDPGVIDSCIRSGAEDYISKPYDIDEFQQRVESYLNPSQIHGNPDFV